MIKILNKVGKKFAIGNILSYEQLNSSQNKVYKVTTDNGIYIVKKYHRDAIKNYYQLNKRKEQIYVSEIMNRQEIDCILPLKVKNKYFVRVDRDYYLVYPYFNYKIIEPQDLTYLQIENLAKLQRKLHSLRIITNIPCSYRKVIIDFNKQKRRFKNNKEIYELLIDNQKILSQLIDKCNQNISNMKNNLCISHNDYKPLNILWDNDKPILLDFDAVGMVNPTCAMCESAFTFSLVNGKIDFDNYRTYLKTYLEEDITDNFQLALYVSMNGKLQWFEYLLSQKRVDVKQMIQELVLYAQNIDKFYEIYEEVKV